MSLPSIVLWHRTTLDRINNALQLLRPAQLVSCPEITTRKIAGEKIEEGSQPEDRWVLELKGGIEDL